MTTRERSSLRFFSSMLLILTAFALPSQSGYAYEEDDKKPPRAADVTEIADEQKALTEKMEALKELRIPEDILKGYVASVESLKNTKEGDSNLKITAKLAVIKVQLEKITEAMKPKFREAGVDEDLRITLLVDPIGLNHIKFEFLRPDKTLVDKAKAGEKTESWVVMTWAEYFGIPYDKERVQTVVKFPDAEHTVTFTVEFNPKAAAPQK